MTGAELVTALLVMTGWAAAVWCIRLPESVWVAADKNRRFWVIWLLIPWVNVIVVVGFVVAALPVLLAVSNGSNGDDQFRRDQP